MRLVCQYQGFLGAAYLWVKAAHVTFVIFWIAGLFIVPRYYVHHQATTPGSAEDSAWIEREDKARTIILDPGDAAGVGAWPDAGGPPRPVRPILVHRPSCCWSSLLTGYQGWIGAYGRKLANGHRELDDRKLRVMNEVPGILTALIVVLVIVRPF